MVGSDSLILSFVRTGNELRTPTGARTRMIMMPYSWRWSSLQLTGEADFWHPTGYRAGGSRPAPAGAAGTGSRSRVAFPGKPPGTVRR